MKDIAVKKAKKTSQNAGAAKPSNQAIALDRYYGQIGISAVAAAVRYQGGAKNLAYAPVAIRWDDRTDEAA